MGAVLLPGALLVAGGSLTAQTVPAAGSWGLTAALPDGGGNTFGLWRMIGARTNLGFEADYRYTRAEDDASTPQLGPDLVARRSRIVLGPTVKRYLRERGPVAAYVRASAAWGWSDDELERPAGGAVERDTKETTQLYRVALGADWFPFPELAIGAFTGIVAVRDDIEVQVAGVGTATRKTTTWNTFRSGIELQYYF